jgi:hypothetical protein
VRLLVSMSAVLCLWVGARPGVCPGQGPPTATRRLHPWGCFAPGAWKLVRVVTETLDQTGTVQNTTTTETMTTLESLDKDGVALLIQGIVQMAGKRLEAEPRCVEQGFFGQRTGAGVTIKDLGTADLTIEGRKIACRVDQVEEKTATARTVTKVYFSDTVAPYVLRRESVTTDPEGKKKLNETTITVVALDLPWRVLSEIKSTALVHAVSRQPKGMTETWAITSPDVPGGVVQHASKELADNGRLVRRSTLELVDYGREPDTKRPGLFRRLRNARQRKPPR